jgi:hypothetical protein
MITILDDQRPASTTTAHRTINVGNRRGGWSASKALANGPRQKARRDIAQPTGVSAPRGRSACPTYGGLATSQERSANA